MKIKISIIGASGYTGQELLRLLSNHANAEVIHITSRKYLGKTASAAFPQLRNTKYAELEFEKADTAAFSSDSDVVFLALPHGESMEYAKKISTRVIDLSADYRFSDIPLYEKWYKPHSDAKTASAATYGLADLYAEKIKDSRIIGNPGCYPTSVLLPLLPLANVNALTGTININSFSGITGAGASPGPKTHFPMINENVMPYSIGNHRHLPEIQEKLRLEGFEHSVVFTPSLIPVDRGIISVITTKTNRNVSQIEEIYNNVYAKSPFVSFSATEFPNLKQARNTNNCIFAFNIQNTNDLLIISVIDNILKGASGQAIQNMNIMFGLDEKEGLNNIAFV